MHQNLWRLVTGGLLLATSACDVNVTNCNKSDAAICDELDNDFDSSVFDGGEDDEDDAGRRDGGSPNDGSADGGAADSGDAAGDDDADLPPQSLTIGEFCSEHIAAGTAWRTAFDLNCGSSAAAADIESALRQWNYFGDDTVVNCVAQLEGSVDRGRLTVVPTKLAECARVHNDQFDTPPEVWPSSGVDLVQLEATVGHGAQTLFQLPACHEALIGSQGAGEECANSFECGRGLRCLPAAAGGRACRAALTVDNCEAQRDCADGYACVGSSSSAAAKTCVTLDNLSTSSCDTTPECAVELVCDNGRCTDGSNFSNVVCAL